MKDKGIKKEEALLLIRKQEKKDKKYLTYLDPKGEEKVRQASSYHMILNMEEFSDIQASKILETALGSLQLISNKSEV